jgi:hypothetical protein
MLRLRGTLMLLFAALVTVLACTPTTEPTGGKAEPSPPPPASAISPLSPNPTPTQATVARVQGDPKELIVQVADLPPGFSLVTEEYDGPNKYAVVYFSPEALVTEAPSEAELMVVAANLTLHGDVAAAGEQFETEEGLDDKSIADSIADTSGEAMLILVQPYPVQVVGTDRAKAVRVDYEVGPTAVVDYRYRFVVGNAVVNLIATARSVGEGLDASSLGEQAQVVVERQVERLIQARR